MGGGGRQVATTPRLSLDKELIKIYLGRVFGVLDQEVLATIFAFRNSFPTNKYVLPPFSAAP